MTQIQK